MLPGSTNQYILGRIDSVSMTADGDMALIFSNGTVMLLEGIFFENCQMETEIRGFDLINGRELFRQGFQDLFQSKQRCSIDIVASYVKIIDKEQFEKKQSRTITIKKADPDLNKLGMAKRKVEL